MIKIIHKSDLDGLEKLKIPDVLRKYINDYYNEMLLRFESENLDGLGSIFVLDSKEVVIASKLRKDRGRFYVLKKYISSLPIPIIKT